MPVDHILKHLVITSSPALSLMRIEILTLTTYGEHSKMLYLMLTFQGHFTSKNMSSMFILGKHISDLGDNLKVFLASSESPILDAVQKQLLDFLSRQF